MKILNAAILIIGIILLPLSLSAQDIEAGPEVTVRGVVYLSLNEALTLALLNNFDVQLNLYDRLIKETDIDKAMSIYDTVLTLTGDYNYNKEKTSSALFGTSSHSGSANAKLTKKLITGTDITVDFQNIRESSDSAFITLNPNYESILEMKFTQPLLKNFFGMNDWGGVRVARIDVRNYKSEVLDKIEEEIADVEKAYWDLAAALKKVEIRRDMYDMAKEFYEINKKKKGLGTSELTDLLAAEANFELRKSELEVEEDNLKTAVNKLKLLINHQNDDEEILPLEMLAVPESEPSFLECLKRAFENRRDYGRARDEIKAKNINFNMKKNQRWPQLDLEGSLKLNGVDAVYKDAAARAFTHENPEYYAKATFSFPFEDRSSRSAYNKAKYEKAKALLELKKAEKTIVTEVDDLVRRARVYKARAEKAMRIEELQRKKLEEEKRQFGYGRSDSDRIIRFQEDYLNSKMSALSALNECRYSTIDLYLTEDTFLKRRGLAIP